MSSPLRAKRKKPKPRLLIVCSRAAQEETFRTLLSKQLPNFEIYSTSSLDSAGKELANKKKSYFSWLLVWERIAEGEDDFALADDGADLAKKWLKKNKRGRAIIVTGPSWDNRPWKFRDRLLGIPEQWLGEASVLADMIAAADAGASFLPPTTVSLEFTKNDKGNCSLRLFGDPEGPLSTYLTKKYFREISHDPDGSFGNFAEIQSAFREALKSPNEEQRRKKLLQLSTDLREELEKCKLFSWLINGVKASQDALWHFSRNDKYRLPCLIHLHLMCARPEMLSVPLGLAMIEPEARPKGYLAAMVPITWRVNCDGSSDSFPEKQKWNITDTDNLKALYSCCEDLRVDLPNGREELEAAAINTAKEEAKEVLKLVGLDTQQPQHVFDSDSLRSALISSAGNTRRSIHLVCHGVHFTDGDYSGIVVGPVSGEPGKGQLVTANNLSPDHSNGEEGPRFIYLNCCELGKQNPRTEGSASYFGGFAEAAIREGVCRELICNRWTVSSDSALSLVKKFYSFQPRTVQGRAAALLHARLAEMQRTKLLLRVGQYNLTWLTPIHIWAYP